MTIHHLLGHRRRRELGALSFYYERTDARHNRCLLQVRGFFSFGLRTDYSHAASVQRELVTPAFVSLAPPASSPSLDANGETDLHVFDASDCSTLQLLQLDRVQKGGVERVLGNRGQLENR